MAALSFDLRQLVRSIARQPGFFAVASLTLAVGFAAHLAAFTVVDRMLLAAPPHVADADRIVRVHIDRDDRNVRRFLWFQTPFRSFEDLRRTPGLFEMMAGYRETMASVGTGADARQMWMVFADHDYFPLLGAVPQRGRVFGADENRAPAGTPVVVLSDRYWRSAHARDESIVGRSLRIGAVDYTVIGVMPPGFNGDATEPVDAWAPFHAGAHELPTGWNTSFLFRSVTVLGKLPRGTSRGAAAEQVTAAYRRLTTDTPAADPTAFAVLASLLPGRAQRGELNQAGQIAVWIEGVALLVLLVALANVVNLQMSRGAQQKREQAVRIALGASRARLLSRLAMEMLFIACAGAAAGILLTYWTATTLQQLLLPGAVGVINLPRFATVAGLTVLVSTVLCTTLSSLQVRLDGISERLKTGRGGDGFSRERLRQSLLVAQMVVSALLLVGAGLFLRSIDRLGKLDFGHDEGRILVATMPLRGTGYAPPAIEAIYERALAELGSLPGVEGVAAAQSTPFAPSQSAQLAVPGMDRLPVEGQSFPTFYTVTPGFFRTMGMEVLRGRGFTDADRAGAPLVMVLEDALAKAMWPREDALGKCIVVGTTNTACRQIVGIVSNTRRFVRTGDAALRYYLPMAQRYVPITPQALFVRTAGEPMRAADTVRAALLRIDPNLPFIRMRTLTEMAEPEKRPWKMGSTLLVVFGAAALLVATAGVYALLSFLVAQRSREIGVRLALGASRTRTVNLIVRQSLGWVLAGLAGGIVTALIAGRFVQPMLFETSPRDPVVFAAAAVTLVAVALAASAIPALRASRVDPNIALRSE